MEKINFNTGNLNKCIDFARKNFNTGTCQNFEFDLSRLNLIDASKTVLLLSVELMKKNTKSTINCIVKDIDTLNTIKPRKLKNTFLSVNLGEKNMKFAKYQKGTYENRQEAAL